MVSSRIYFDNLLTEARFSAFQVAGGAVANAAATWSEFYPYAAGKVALESRGTYTGDREADYLIEVQAGSDGTFPGSRWRWSDTGGTVWNVSNLIPVTGVWVTLNNGVEVRWVDTSSYAGTPQFVAADYYYARALRPYGIVKALDGSRNTTYRSGTFPVNSTLRIGFDFGVALQPQFLGALDLNLPSNASVSLRADASLLFDATPDFTQTVTLRAGGRWSELVTSPAYRYWWLQIVNGATTGLPYVQISELFLGWGFIMGKAPIIGFSANRQWLGTVDPNLVSRGPGPRIYASEEVSYTWDGVKEDGTEDGAKLQAAWDYAQSYPSYTSPPLWFVLQDDQLSKLMYYSWAGQGLEKQNRMGAGPDGRFDYRVTWTEVIRTAAS